MLIAVVEPFVVFKCDFVGLYAELWLKSEYKFDGSCTLNIT
jgi:hypothetical protein